MIHLELYSAGGGPLQLGVGLVIINDILLQYFNVYFFSSDYFKL